MTKTYILTEENLLAVVRAAITCGEEIGEAGETEVIRKIAREAVEWESEELAQAASVGWLAIPVKGVNLLRDNNGPDRISITIADELAKEIHGSTYAFWRGAHFDLQCAHKHGERALYALGLEVDEVTQCGV